MAFWVDDFPNFPFGGICIRSLEGNHSGQSNVPRPRPENQLDDSPWAWGLNKNTPSWYGGHVMYHIYSYLSYLDVSKPRKSCNSCFLTKNSFISGDFFLGKGHQSDTPQRTSVTKQSKWSSKHGYRNIHFDIWQPNMPKDGTVNMNKDLSFNSSCPYTTVQIMRIGIDWICHRTITTIQYSGKHIHWRVYNDIATLKFSMLCTYM